MSESQMSRIKENLRQSLERAKIQRRVAGKVRIVGDNQGQSAAVQTDDKDVVILSRDTANRISGDATSRVMEVPQEMLTAIVSQVEALHSVIDMILLSSVLYSNRENEKKKTEPPEGTTSETGSEEETGSTSMDQRTEDEVRVSPSATVKSLLLILERLLKGSDRVGGEGEGDMESRTSQDEVTVEGAATPQTVSSDPHQPRDNDNQNSNGERFPSAVTRHLSPYSVRPLTAPYPTTPPPTFSLYEHVQQMPGYQPYYSVMDDSDVTDPDPSLSPRLTEPHTPTLQDSSMLNQALDANMLRTLLRDRQRDNERLRVKVATLKQHNKNLELQNDRLCEALEKQKVEMMETAFPSSVTTWIRMATALAVNALIIKLLRLLFKI